MNVKDWNRSILLSIAIPALFQCTGCPASHDIPEGYWQSLQGKPALTLRKDTCGHYQAIVYHPMDNGLFCPIVYPVIREASGTYIQAEGRILLTYTPKDGILFLSPGGKYKISHQSAFTRK